MSPALVRVDVVRERVDRLGVAVVPLQRDLDVDAVALPVHVDRLVVDRRLVQVQVLDERVDAPFVQELVALAVPFVVDRNRDAAVQEGQLAEPLRQRVEAVIGRLEDLRVRLERDSRAALLRRARDFELSGRIASLVGLLVDLPVAPDLGIECFRQRVDDRQPDAVEAARDLVAVVVELATGMEHGQHDLGRRSPADVSIDRNTTAVINDRHGLVDVQGDADLIAEAGERLVDRVVDDFVDEVMQAERTRRADVHGRTLAHGLETLEDFDLVRAVIVRAAAVPADVGRRRQGSGQFSFDGGILRILRWFCVRHE